ncbi:MAG: methyltransferase domain-containing protein [Methylovirgula sp.]
MIAALGVGPDHRVLEIGTGSGYATAILAELAAQVMSLERFQTLALAARLRLERLGKQNAEIVFTDGLALPASAGPFDRILIHARLESLPPSLAALLSVEGRIVMARPHARLPHRQMLVELRTARVAKCKRQNSACAACRPCCRAWPRFFEGGAR